MLYGFVPYAFQSTENDAFARLQDLALVCPLAGEFFNLGRINTRSARNCRFRGTDLEQFPESFAGSLPWELSSI